MAFGSLGDVENWLASPGHTIGVLRGHVTSGTMSGENARWAKAWIEQYDAMSEAGRREREIGIQQAALDATNRATLAAERSARFTMWAAVAAAVGALAAAGGLAIQFLSTERAIEAPPHSPAPAIPISPPTSPVAPTSK